MSKGRYILKLVSNLFGTHFSLSIKEFPWNTLISVPSLSGTKHVPKINPFSQELLEAKHWVYSERDKRKKKKKSNTKNDLGAKKYVPTWLRGHVFHL